MSFSRKIVIVGGGFGGLQVAKGLCEADAEVTVIDKSNHHLFQPLLYQVATAGLSPADIASPIRSILKRQKNAQVIMGEVVGIDPLQKEVKTNCTTLKYDYLVLATGSKYNYFGHEDWREHAPSLKTLQDATNIRKQILLAFEKAELEEIPQRQMELLTIVLVGAGPTGVEMAGAIAELTKKAMARDFRRINPKLARIILIEAATRILSNFDEGLSQKAHHALTELGVEIQLGTRVLEVSERRVKTNRETIEAFTIIWTAGIIASSIGRWLHLPCDNLGRVEVLEDLTLSSYRDIYVLGDAALFHQDGKPLAGLASVAQQQGRYVARALLRKLSGKAVVPFHYEDKGVLATVGRSFAVADFKTLKLSGFVGWIIWLSVHIYQLIGFRNRAVVLFQWLWGYLSFQRGARIIP